MARDADELLTTLALRRVAERYAVAADRRDADLFAAQFTTDGELISPRGQWSGRDQIRGVVDGLRQRYLKTFHAVLTQVADIDGDRAGAETYCIARHFIRDPSGARACHEMTIRYQDAFARTHEGWLLSRRELIVDATHTFAVDESSF